MLAPPHAVEVEKKLSQIIRRKGLRRGKRSNKKGIICVACVELFLLS